jgi:hypothetical protein
MSHFTTVATKITDIGCLISALCKLKLSYAYDTRGVVVNGWRGQTTQAELAIRMGRYDIGMVKDENGAYALIGDWWGIETSTGKTEGEIIEQITQAYSVEKVLKACADAGYEITEQEVQADGSVTVTVGKWA